ncbi:MAG TPA: FAD-dependent monooxygenase, partial [Planctomycetota bacterium]|nr:FAD-dependent monooxygenase [Planctomycetota bacterium]
VAGVRGVRHGKEPFEVRADVVVGADGRYSAIRRLGGFTPEYEEDDFDIIWFVVDPPPGWSKTIYFSVGTVPPLLMLPKYPNHIQIGLVFPKGGWRAWRKEGVPAVAARLRKLSPLFGTFADGLKDFTPFFPLPAVMSLVRDWARDGLLLVGDAAHTMSPAGAIGVNVALATAAVAAQVIHPRLGRGPIPATALARVQALRESDVRTLHRFQRRAGQVLLGTGSRNPLLRTFLQRGLPLVVRSKLFPLLQRRILFGVPLPPLDPGFNFRT